MTSSCQAKEFGCPCRPLNTTNNHIVHNVAPQGMSGLGGDSTSWLLQALPAQKHCPQCHFQIAVVAAGKTPGPDLLCEKEGCTVPWAVGVSYPRVSCCSSDSRRQLVSGLLVPPIWSQSEPVVSRCVGLCFWMTDNVEQCLAC